MVITIWPSQMWYLTLASEVRPTSGNIDDILVTGRKRKAQHRLPSNPSLNPALPSFCSHLFFVIKMTD